MEENTFKIILIVLMLIMLASTVAILAYQSGSLVLEGGVYLGSISINVDTRTFNVPLNLTVRLYNPLNRTVTVFYRVQSDPPELASHVHVENRGFDRVAPLSEGWGYITVVVEPCVHTGTVTIIALGK